MVGVVDGEAGIVDDGVVVNDGVKLDVGVNEGVEVTEDVTLGVGCGDVFIEIICKESSKLFKLVIFVSVNEIIFKFLLKRHSKTLVNT